MYLSLIQVQTQAFYQFFLLGATSPQAVWLALVGTGALCAAFTLGLSPPRGSFPPAPASYFWVHAFVFGTPTLPWLPGKRCRGGKSSRALHIWKCLHSTLRLYSYFGWLSILVWRSFFFRILKPLFPGPLASIPSRVPVKKSKVTQISGSSYSTPLPFSLWKILKSPPSPWRSESSQ